MIPGRKTIAELLTSKPYFYIPVYQRKYTWKAENCDTLFSDVLTLVNNNDDTQSHFLGTCALAQSDDDSYIIIDGQQRITTTILLIKALSDFAKSRNQNVNVKSFLEYTDPLTNETKVKLIHNNRDDAGKFRDTLNLERPESPSKDQFQRNYKFFYGKIKEICKEREESNIQDIINRVFRKVMNKLFLISLTIESNEDPQTIFQTINSTGVPLGITDLVKNYLLLPTRESNSESLYALWTDLENLFSSDGDSKEIQDFIRQYVVYKSDDPKIPQAKDALQLYERFNRLFSSSDNKEVIIREMIKIAKWYKFISQNSNSEVVRSYYDDMDIHMMIRRLNNMNLNAVYPFVIHMLNGYDDNDSLSQRCLFINLDDLKRSIQIFNSYVFQQTIKDQKKYLSQESARLYRRIRETINNEPSISFSTALRRNLLQSPSFTPMSRNQLVEFLKKQEFSSKTISGLLYDLCDLSVCNRGTVISLIGSVERSGKNNLLGNITILAPKGNQPQSVSDEDSFKDKKNAINNEHIPFINDRIVHSSNDTVWTEEDFNVRTEDFAGRLAVRYIDILFEEANSSIVDTDSLPTPHEYHVFFENKSIDFNPNSYQAYWNVFIEVLKVISRKHKSNIDFYNKVLDLPSEDELYLDGECIFVESKPDGDSYELKVSYEGVTESVFVIQTNRMALFTYLKDVLLPYFGYQPDVFRVELLGLNSPGVCAQTAQRSST